MSSGPLVSILIPAYNAGSWIADTIRSALAQTWQRKEIIVVDDGSRDDTAAIARTFESTVLKVVCKDNEGAAATRNRAYALSQGDYIQYLDADDLLSPGKIQRQIDALGDASDRRTLLSCPWGYFAYRPEKARFVETALWEDLSPVEWMVRKFGRNLHQQTATWLTSRELAEAAGPWNTRLLGDDDGDYFGRVLVASSGTKFVREARVYYRLVPSNRLSFIGDSDRKMDAQLASMRASIGYLLALEDSPRVRTALLSYLHCWGQFFHPRRTDIFFELEQMARALGGTFERPPLRAKYRWLEPVVGLSRAWELQIRLPYAKSRVLSEFERLAVSGRRRVGDRSDIRAVDG
jgi:glycosyltransferase involved in cell wall biosynthesis